MNLTQQVRRCCGSEQRSFWTGILWLSSDMPHEYLLPLRNQSSAINYKIFPIIFWLDGRINIAFFFFLKQYPPPNYCLRDFQVFSPFSILSSCSCRASEASSNMGHQSSSSSADPGLERQHLAVHQFWRHSDIFNMWAPWWLPLYGKQNGGKWLLAQNGEAVNLQIRYRAEWNNMASSRLPW